MFPRLGRLGFIISRSCFLSFIVIVLLQLLAQSNNGHHTGDQSNSNPWIAWIGEHRAYWKTLANEDEAFSDEQRIAQVKLKGIANETKFLNWTSIFWDIYSRKTSKIEERDGRTPYKRFFEQQSSPMTQTTIEIYEETTVFGQPKFCSFKRIFHPQCPFTNCRWRCDEPTINAEGIRRASVFHHSDVKHDDMPQKLLHRSPMDIWILWNDEANYNFESLNPYEFNWTLSFRQDAEVSVGSYGLLIQRTDLRTLVNEQDPTWINMLIEQKIPITDIDLENRIYTNFRYRHRYAFWLVSNCQPQRRLKFYEQLKQFYPVKAFGSCVEEKCEKNDRCQSDYSHLAMFYLAFESQTCTDYITEKFWRAISYGMIPVVLGPSKQSYLDLNIPASAFIHVDDFSSAKDMATYLGRVALNYHIYRQYFQWLTEYNVFHNIDDLEPIRMCELCMKLNLQKVEEHSFYTDIHAWFRTGC